MPNLASAKKNMRKSRAAAIRNRAQKSALRTALKRASAGTTLPMRSVMTSPGTRSPIGIVSSRPDRSTSASGALRVEGGADPFYFLIKPVVARSPSCPA